MKADNFLYEALVDDPKPCRKAVIRLELKDCGFQILPALKDLKVRASVLPENRFPPPPGGVRGGILR